MLDLDIYLRGGESMQLRCGAASLFCFRHGEKNAAGFFSRQVQCRFIFRNVSSKIKVMSVFPENIRSCTGRGFAVLEWFGQS